MLAGLSGLVDPRGFLVRRASQCDDVNSRIIEQGVRRWREIEACRCTQAGGTSRIIFPTGDDDGLRLLLQRKRHELAVGAAVADDSHAITLGHLPAFPAPKPTSVVSHPWPTRPGLACERREMDRERSAEWIASALSVGRRVVVTGMAGAGKSTFSRALSAKTGLPVIHLDVHFWQPGWTDA